MLDTCSASVVDDETALIEHWLYVSVCRVAKSVLQDLFVLTKYDVIGTCSYTVWSDDVIIKHWQYSAQLELGNVCVCHVTAKADLSSCYFTTV